MVPMVSAVVWSLVSNVFTLDTPTGGGVVVVVVVAVVVVAVVVVVVVVAVVVVVVAVVVVVVDRFCIALFSALEQTHSALELC